MAKVHIVIGPTSSGKSDYAVKLAKKVKGEIISADSRQVYKGFAQASGQVPGKWHLVKSEKLKVKSHVFVYKGVPHYCIDFVSPKRVYTVADFVKDGQKALKNILLRGKTPIICGGTGHYVDALLFGQNLPDVPPDKKFREQMEKISAEQLFAKLQKLDPARAKTIDPHNKRRLIRALEIIHHTGKPVPETSSNYKVVKLVPPQAWVYPAKGVDSKLKNNDNYNHYQTEIIDKSNNFPDSDYSGAKYSFGSPPNSEGSGVVRRLVAPISYEVKGIRYQLRPVFHYLNPSAEELYPKIEKRLKQRVKQGMLEELWLAHKKGVSWKRLEDMGLEFRHTSRFLRSLNPRHSSEPLDSDHSDKLRKLGLYSSNSYHSDKICKLGLYFLKSSHFQDLLSDIKKYTKRQRTWFKRYSPPSLS